jgi:hypothetical protein
MKKISYGIVCFLALVGVVSCISWCIDFTEKVGREYVVIYSHCYEEYNSYPIDHQQIIVAEDRSNFRNVVKIDITTPDGSEIKKGDVFRFRFGKIYIIPKT